VLDQFPLTSFLAKFTLRPALLLMAVSWLVCQVPAASELDEASSAADGGNVDRITYVNSAGDVFTIKGDGSDRRQLTGGTQAGSGPTGPFLAQGIDFDSFYAWPTWSPDGAKLAVSRVRASGGQNAEVTIQMLDSVTGRSRTVYDSDFPGLVADGSPHYLYWSPDSRNLSFLASTPNGLTLFVTDTETNNPHIGLDRGAPLYYSWSGDGNSLSVHIGEEIKLFRELSDHASGEVLATARGFRVPAFSPDGQWLAYVNQTESGSALFIVQVDDLDHPTRLTNVGAFSAFMWSPTGEELAVADQTGGSTVAFERLRVVSAGSGQERTVAEESLLAFYWSPDGRRIAWVALERERQTFEWKVSSIVPGAVAEGRSLFRFHPSGEVLTMLSFFDQYAYSHSPWSPDSSHLVVAGTERMPFERRNGHTPTGARVFVLDADSDTPPQDISEGTLAFWSWN
jgi:TolB protein